MAMCDFPNQGNCLVEGIDDKEYERAYELDVELCRRWGVHTSEIAVSFIRFRMAVFRAEEDDWDVDLGCYEYIGAQALLEELKIFYGVREQHGRSAQQRHLDEIELVEAVFAASVAWKNASRDLCPDMFDHRDCCDIPGPTGTLRDWRAREAIARVEKAESALGIRGFL